MSKTAVTVILLLLVTTPPGQAQGKCDGTMTLKACWELYQKDFNGSIEVQATDSKDTQEAELKNKPTGLDTALPALSTNTKNFLPLLALAGVLGSATDDDNGGALNLDLNFLIPGLSKSKNAQLQATVNTQPQISSGLDGALKAAGLSDPGLEEVTGSLENSLGDLDDYSVNFSYSWVGARSGRGFAQYARRFDRLAGIIDDRFKQSWEQDLRLTFKLLDSMQAMNLEVQDPLPKTFAEIGEAAARTAASTKVRHEAVAAARAQAIPETAIDKAVNKAKRQGITDLDRLEDIAQKAAAEKLKEIGDKAVAAEEERIEQEVDRTKAKYISDFNAEFEGWLVGNSELVQDHQQAYAEAGLDSFADLVHNQPQLFVGLKGRFKDPLVGQDEVSANATLEWSVVNLNAALPRDCQKKLDSSLQPQVPLDPCLKTFANYVEERKGSIKDAGRFSFSLEYVKGEEETLDLSMVTIPEGEMITGDLSSIPLPGYEKFIVSAGYSRNFAAIATSQQPFRLDLVAKYEDVSDDPMRQDRLVATLTVTSKFGGLSLPLGLVYANRSEFLTDVDKQFSAHLGLKFDGFTGKNKNQANQ